MSATIDNDDKNQANFEHESNAGDSVEIKRTDELQHNINEPHSIYAEALARYPTDESIDQKDETKLKRKLDRRILPLLGICYFFYYVDKTTLSYAAIFGIKDDLPLRNDEYSWLSSLFYFGWLFYAIPSNLMMQKCPPGWYLSFNIFMWGVLLMAQAAANNFATIAALRILSGAFEAIADPAFMMITSMYYTRAEQPSRIAAWYIWNGIGVAGGGLIGYGIGNIKGALQSWRYEFIVVGAACSFWAIILCLLLPNSPVTFWGFSHDEKLIMIARMRRNQTGVEQRRINWSQIKEAYLDYKTWLFTLLGFVSNIPNGGISNFSTLVIKGLGFDTLNTALLGIPQGAIVVIWIGLAALCNRYMPNNSRTLVCALFMIPTIAGALGFLLAPADAYVGRLICFYLTGSYQASFVVSLSLITSNTGGQSKKMIVSGMIWFGACIGNIVSPFFYRSEQAPSYPMGIGSLLAANIIQVILFFVFRFAFIRENRLKERKRAELRARGEMENNTLNDTAFTDMTDKQNPNFVHHSTVDFSSHGFPISRPTNTPRGLPPDIILSLHYRSWFTPPHLQALRGIAIRNVLIDISNHQKLSRFLSHVIIGLDSFETCHFRPGFGQTAAKNRYEAGLADETALLSTGQDREMLAQAFRNLPNLQTVGLRDFGSGGRVRENGQWHSYGATTIFLETGVRLLDGRGAYTIPGETSFAGRAFSSILYALGQSGAKPQTFEVILRKRGLGLPHDAFKISKFFEPSVMPLLSSLETLLLTVNPTLAANESGIDDDPDVEYSDFPLRQYLCHTPNLAHLRLNFQSPLRSNPHRFMVWLGRPVVQATPANSSLGALLPKSPSPVSLFHLRRLDIGMLAISPRVLLTIIHKFKTTLRSLSLWKIYLEPEDQHRRVGERSSVWPKFFAKVPDLEYLSVGCIGQVLHNRHQRIGFKLPAGRTGEPDLTRTCSIHSDMANFMNNLKSDAVVTWPEGNSLSDDDESMSDESSDSDTDMDGDD
ncbi:hypothetical protein V495_02905 [Pseudogymnoascus sp. VKM F-4514 (FW-929)]|nr:hypothetical protein V495_02905 [Pseudogymnoascus sp. VKM F-4514 (FW-929)]KFY53947.1 hypothetical protein V497_08096 [Pseudogymnoascus sp. VKM F-4516 (FW-969)]